MLYPLSYEGRGPEDYRRWRLFEMCRAHLEQSVGGGGGRGLGAVDNG